MLDFQRNREIFFRFLVNTAKSTRCAFCTSIYGSVKSPKPSSSYCKTVLFIGGHDAHTVSDKIADVHFYAAVLISLGGAPGFVFAKTAFQVRDFVFIVTFAQIFRGTLMIFSLLIMDANSWYSFSLYLDNPLPSYLIRIFSMMQL